MTGHVITTCPQLVPYGSWGKVIWLAHVVHASISKTLPADQKMTADQPKGRQHSFLLSSFGWLPLGTHSAGRLLLSHRLHNLRTCSHNYTHFQAQLNGEHAGVQQCTLWQSCPAGLPFSKLPQSVPAYTSAVSIPSRQQTCPQAHFSSATSLGMPLLRLMVRMEVESEDRLWRAPTARLRTLP